MIGLFAAVALALLNELMQQRLVLGGAVTETALCVELRARAARMLADPFTAVLGCILFTCSEALLEIPRTLAHNTGMDAVTVCESLLAAHADGQRSVGIDCMAAQVRDMSGSGVVEPLASKTAQIALAAEAAMAVVRIDAILVWGARRGGRVVCFVCSLRTSDSDGAGKGG